MRVTWAPQARADRHRIWMFTAERSVERADRITARLDRVVATLGGLPRQGWPKQGGMRELSIPDIQLSVVYRIIDEEDAIRILRVWSTRQDRGTS